MNRARLIAADVDSGCTIGSFKDPVTLGLEILTRQAAEIFFVLYQKNRFDVGTLCGGGNRRYRHAFLGFGEARKIDFERCTLRQFAVDPNISAALFDDAVDHRQAEPGSLRTLGGEEG